MNIKRKLNILLITIITLSCLISVNSLAADIPEGRTISDTDVSLSAISGKKLKITLSNNSKANVNKVQIEGTNTNLAIKGEGDDSYIEYEGEPGIILLGFYKDNTLLATKSLEVLKDGRGNLLSNFAPAIAYEGNGLTDNARSFLIKDSSGVEEITITKATDNAEIYKFSNKNESKKDGNYIVSSDTSKNPIKISLKRLSEDGYYNIKAKDNKGLVHNRKVKVAKVKATNQSNPSQPSKPETPTTKMPEGRTISDTDVSLAATKGKKLKITLKNNNTVKVNKVLIEGTNQKLAIKGKGNKSYIEYSGNPGIIKLGFYKDNKQLATKTIEILKNGKGELIPNFAPVIAYEKDGLKTNARNFIIQDKSGVEEITITKASDNKIIYKLSNKNETKYDKNYIVSSDTSKNPIKISLKRLSTDQYYNIKAKDNRGLIHNRKVKVAKLKTQTSTPNKPSNKLKAGRTLLNFKDVNLKATGGEKVKISIENQKDVNVEKIILTDGTNPIKESKQSYIEYAGIGVFQLEFYKKGAKIPFETKNVEIMQNAKTKKYSANFSPAIAYEKNGLKDKYRIFKIVDGRQSNKNKNASKVKEITIYKKNSEGKYDYKTGTIIYKLDETKDNKYIKSVNTTNLNNVIININRLNVDGYYMIVAKDNYGMTHRREVKVPKTK